ncbi:hypothetical protein B0H11DRAFT_2416299 [Mycena galericulata]|nr:hypothetical protein B0H11DRAFT_2416299 [Mycena galericulata]
MVARDLNAGESKAARAATRARISKLDNEIDSLQRSIDALIIERDKCRRELATYKYPVLCLPAITSEIFTQFLPSYPERSLLFGSLSPSFLCRICRQWRDVAMSTPVLWKAFRLNLNLPRLYEHHLHLLELWLQRSGGCPLSIELSCDCRMLDDFTISFVKAIVHHARRWEEIHLILPQNEFHRIAGPMPLLRNVFVGPTEYPRFPEPGAAPVVLFAQAPKLKDVALHLTFNPFSITLPWSQITTLTATLLVQEAVAILRETPALEECRFSMYSLAQSTEPILPLPPLVWLHSLSLLLPKDDDEMPVSIGRFLAALNLPALESVTVFEPFLGADSVPVLSALRSSGYPRRIEVIGANPFPGPERYAAAFPEATVSVELASLDEESDSDESY